MIGNVYSLIKTPVVITVTVNVDGRDARPTSVGNRLSNNHFNTGKR